jgi:hypothetical protein
MENFEDFKIRVAKELREKFDGYFQQISDYQTEEKAHKNGEYADELTLFYDELTLVENRFTELI